MNRRVSISYPAVKTKVYRLIDALVEDARSERDIQESAQRWWKQIHPSDRPVARKYLLSVLEKSHASLSAIKNGLHEFNDFDERLHLASEKLPKSPTLRTGNHNISNIWTSCAPRLRGRSNPLNKKLLDRAGHVRKHSVGLTTYQSDCANDDD